MVEKKSENLRKKEESQGILTGCPNLKVLPFLRFSLMILVSSECYIKKVMKNFLRSGRSLGK